MNLLEFYNRIFHVFYSTRENLRQFSSLVLSMHSIIHFFLPQPALIGFEFQKDLEVMTSFASQKP